MKKKWFNLFVNVTFMASSTLSPYISVAADSNPVSAPLIETRPALSVASPSTLSTQTYEQVVADCDQNPDGRCTHEQLERIIQIVSSEDSKQEYEINALLAAKQFSRYMEIPSSVDRDNPEALQKALIEAFHNSGGYFASKIRFHHGQKLLVNDNNFQYVWSLQGPGKKVKRPFNHIIKQRSGTTDQKEMKRFMREGDIVVYWHPETRGDSLDTYNQWRASHAATVVESKSNDPDTGKFSFKLMTADTPAGYARPFDGQDKLPFHVFRFVPRNKNGVPVKDWQEYGKNIAKWASLGFARFPFNGDYHSLNLKSKSRLKDFRDKYLDGQIFDFGRDYAMYCAWFVFTNLNLGYHFPFNEKGMKDLVEQMAQKRQADSSISAVSSSDIQDFKKDLLSYLTGPISLSKRPYVCQDENNLNQLTVSTENNECFLSKDDLEPAPGKGNGQSGDNKLAMNIVTAPTLIMNFVNKVFGSERDNLPELDEANFDFEKYFKQAVLFATALKVKSQFLAQAGDSLTYRVFASESDSRGWSPVSNQLSSQEYNTQVKNEMNNGVKNYTEKANLAEAAIAKIGELKLTYHQNLSGDSSVNEAIMTELKKEHEKLSDIERQVRRKLYDLVRESRSPGKGGKAWMPPYGYMAEADNTEINYKKGAYQNTPQLVYVGTVVHENFLKNFGTPDVAEIKLTPAKERTDVDVKVEAEITKLINSIPEDGTPNPALRRANHYVSKYFNLDSDNPIQPESEQTLGYGLMWFMMDQSYEASHDDADKRGHCFFNPGDKAKGCYQGTKNDPGINAYEGLALRLARKAWNLNARSDSARNYHNNYGVDSVIFNRMMLAQWNQLSFEKSFAPVIYGGHSWWATKTAKNSGLLFSKNDNEYPRGLSSKPLSGDTLHFKVTKAEHVSALSLEEHNKIDVRMKANPDRRPRRLNPLPCVSGAGESQQVNAANAESWLEPSCNL